MTRSELDIVIIGGGLSGSLLAILLARRGLAPLVLERAAPFSPAARPQGRSINLALAARGIAALEAAGAQARIAPLTIPMRGRMLHDPGQAPRLAPYGQRESEQIYSVSRADLHLELYRLASEQYGIEYRFHHECIDLDPEQGHVTVATPRGRASLELGVAFVSDGAGSSARRALQSRGLLEASEDLLDHGYKEFSLPPGAHGQYLLQPHALHIWPRGEFMLIALPNLDRSFTATLFLPLEGESGFASVTETAIVDFFAREFPDALPLMPSLVAEYAAHPTGLLGTISCRPWHIEDRVLLLGDAAHAIVPFHGQGMNAAFEDCAELDRLIAAHGPDWARVFPAFAARRGDNARAIAEMALDNYAEMRDRVRDARFKLETELAFELERRFPESFVPRYSMVMFHPEIEYAEAQRLGALQTRILRQLTESAASLADVDFERAAELVRRELC